MKTYYRLVHAPGCTLLCDRSTGETCHAFHGAGSDRLARRFAKRNHVRIVRR